MYKDLEEHMTQFQEILAELTSYEADGISYDKIYRVAAIIQKNFIEYQKLLLEEKKLEAFKQAHVISDNAPSALEAIAMCLGMGTSGTLSSRITDIVDAINNED